jgi:3-deoxy-D-manno-octulosonic-acid transferase
LVITAATESGLTEAQRKFPDLIVHPWPCDLTWAIHNAFDVFQPWLVVLAESELWPNFLQIARRRRIPVCVVNGRLSPRTQARLQRWPHIAQHLLLDPVTHFAVQTPTYAQYLRSLGVPPFKITITGSLKYEGAIQHDKAAVFRLGHWLGLSNTRYATCPAWRPPATADEPILWLAGSTHAPEEEIVLQVLIRLRHRHPNLHLILVPRHPDRFDTVTRLVATTSLSWIRRSQHPQPLSSLPAVIVWDTVGELHAAWGLADIGFVGGSFDGRRGGQNMIEPAAQGVPCLFGPHVWNFREPAQQLVEAGGAICLQHPDELEAELERLLLDPIRRQQMGLAAYQFVLTQQGAVQRTVEVLESLVRYPPATSAQRQSYVPPTIAAA